MPTSENGDAYLRQLLDEARQMKTKPLPTGASWGWNPSYLTHGIDTQAEWDEDQRHDYVLSKLAATYPDPRMSLPNRLAQEVEAYKEGRRKDIQSPYHYRGWYTSGAPLHNVVQGISALPSLAYAGSAMLANAVDPVAPYDPNAKKTWDSSLNTLTAYGAEAAGLVPKGTPTFADVAEDARQQRGDTRGRLAANKSREAWNADTQAEADKRTDSMYIDGTEHYERAGVPKPAAYFLGAFSDSALDPWGGLGFAARTARAGKPMRALRDLISEFGLGQAAAGVAATGGLSGQ